MVGARQFEIGDFDEGINCPRTERIGQTGEVLIRRVAATAVRDQQGRFFSGRRFFEGHRAGPVTRPDFHIRFWHD